MPRSNPHQTRRTLLRLARLSAVGAAGLLLVTACSDYSTTGSGGTAGADPAGGTSAGTGGGGLVATPSGGNNMTDGGRAGSGGQESGTAGNPPGATLIVPTPDATGDTSVPAVPRDASGTPQSAGTGPAVATSEAIDPDSGVPVTPVESPVISTPTPTPTPAR